MKDKTIEIVNFTEEELEIIRLSGSIELLIKSMELKSKMAKSKEGRKEAEILLCKLRSITIGQFYEIKNSNRFVPIKERDI